MAVHSKYTGSIKELAVDYKEITLHFGKLEELVKISLENSEMHHDISLTVNNLLKDTKMMMKHIQGQNTKEISEKIISSIVIFSPIYF